MGMSRAPSSGTPLPHARQREDEFAAWEVPLRRAYGLAGRQRIITRRRPHILALSDIVSARIDGRGAGLRLVTRPASLVASSAAADSVYLYGRAARWE